MTREPLVSVVLATHNRADLLKLAAESALSQTYKSLELILVDDASVDHTPRVIEELQKRDARVRHLRNEANVGRVKSANRGIQASRGLYIARIDDDDVWRDPAKLAKQASFLESHPEYMAVSGGVVRVDRAGKVFLRLLSPLEDKDIRNAMLQFNPLAQSAIMFRKKAWQEEGGYDERLESSVSEDWDLWMRLGKKGKLYNFPEYFARCLETGQNLTRQRFLSNAITTLALRLKYRKDYPNFVQGYVRGLVSLLLSFVPFHFFLRRIFWRMQERGLKPYCARAFLMALNGYLKWKVWAWSAAFGILHGKRRRFEKKVQGSFMELHFFDWGISRELLYAGVREVRSTKFLQTFLSAGDVCLDVGANIGYYALQEARLVGERGRVFCIEPSRNNIKALEENVKRNGYKNMEVFRAAVGRENKKAQLHLSKSSNWHSFLPTGLDFSGESEEVDMITIDSFLAGRPSPDFVRMDVEGYESEVIRGMKGLLAAGKPLKLFIELHCQVLEDGGRELLEMLAASGFRIRAVFKENMTWLTREPRLFVRLHEYLFKTRCPLFRGAFESYDSSIAEFLKELLLRREVTVELFLERP